MLHNAAEREFRGVCAHDRDAHPGLVCVCDVPDGGVGGHQIGEVPLHIGRGEIDDRGARGVDYEKCDVARAGLEAFDDLTRRRIFNRHDGNPETRCQRAGELHGHPSDLAGRRVLGVHRREERDSHSAGPNEIRDSRVGTLLFVV
jgi:hypothetical protein